MYGRGGNLKDYYIFLFLKENVLVIRLIISVSLRFRFQLQSWISFNFAYIFIITSIYNNSDPILKSLFNLIYHQYIVNDML